MSINNIPYGFHSRSIDGYEKGFPVLFENKLGSVRSAELMQYLIDGKYLDKSVRLSKGVRQTPLLTD